jgi:hypothetical protein
MIRRALVAALLAGAPVLAYAQSSSAPLVVSATVVSSCRVYAPSPAEGSMLAAMPVAVMCSRRATMPRIERPQRIDARDAVVTINF